MSARSTPTRTKVPPGPATLLATLLVMLAIGCAPKRPENLVIISLDTTRKDHLPSYGYARSTAPRIDRLARGGAVFENAVAQMTITNPSHASMLTGLYPHTHRVGENTRRLSDQHLTLAEILRAAGYRTAAFVSGHPLRQEITGIDQGFEVYDSEFTTRRRLGRLTTNLARRWLRERRGGERYFLFLHLYDAHGPYRPRAEYEGLFRSLDPGAELEFIPEYQTIRDRQGNVVRRLNDYIDRYDALIRYQDDLVGELLGEVDLARTLVVVVADHGETLGERAAYLNLNHGTSVFEEQVGIPLVFHGPGLLPARLHEPVETVDLLPTVLELLGVALPEGLKPQGESLVPLLRGESGAQPGALAYASNRARSAEHADRGYRLRERDLIHSVRDRRYKLVSYPGVDRDYVELYDLERDPAESLNLAGQEPEIEARLKGALKAWQAQGAPSDPAPALELSPELREGLEALGYLESE